MEPLFKDSTEVSFGTMAYMEGRTGQPSRAADYDGRLRSIYETVYGDGLLVYFRRLGRANIVSADSSLNTIWTSIDNHLSKVAP